MATHRAIVVEKTATKVVTGTEKTSINVVGTEPVIQVVSITSTILS